MKFKINPIRGLHSGYALLISIVFMGIALLVLASVMSWGTNSARQTERNNLFNMGQGAAEAADERVISQMMRDFFNQTYNSAASYATNLPLQTNWPASFSFADGSGTANKTGVQFGNGTFSTNWPAPLWAALSGQYAGLCAYVVQATITSTATATNQPYSVPATVSEVIQFDSIPLAQFAIFYNMEMEINPGSDMTIRGPVFANGPIFASTYGTLTFNNTVKTISSYTHGIDTANDGQGQGTGPVVFNAPPYAAQTNQAPLTMPVNGATNANAILQLPPSGVSPYSSTGQVYLANEADLIISNSSGNVLTAYYQNSNNAPNAVALIPYDVTNINVATHTTNTYYSFVTNVSFYDYRETATVKAVQINVAKFNTWTTNANGGLSYNNDNNTDKGHGINSIYIFNNMQFSSSQLPAVRLTNGAVLPSQGLTVATPQPIYVLGNYNASSSDLGTTNTADTAPAALMGDAVTILSSSWSDAYTSGTSLSSRPTVNTTVNAATFEGIVQSTHIGSTKYYSGGVENFLRLLENWKPNSGSQKTLTYNGAIIVMFPSQFATNYWNGSVYSIPVRNWSFDLNFETLSGQPPLMPTVKALQRISWTAK